MFKPLSRNAPSVWKYALLFAGLGLLLPACRRGPQLQSTWNRPLEVAEVPGQEVCVELWVRTAGNFVLEFELQGTGSAHPQPAEWTQEQDTRLLKRNLYFSSPRTQEVCTFLPEPLLREGLGSGNYEVRLLRADGFLLESLHGRLEQSKAAAGKRASASTEAQQGEETARQDSEEPVLPSSNAGMVESVDTRDLQDAPQAGKK